MSDVLAAPVEAFVESVAPALIALAPSGTRPEALRSDVALEAYQLVCAFIDADGRHTDEELWALIATFSGRLESQLHRATPADVRSAGLVNGKRTWLDAPSLLLGTLIDADRRDGTTNAWTYYERAMDLAHVVASLDAVPTHAELVALDRFRSALLAAMTRAGLPRPGQRPSGPADPAAPTHAGAPVPTGEEREELPPPRPLEELLAELDELIGLEAVKAEVRMATALIRVAKLREERGLKTADRSNHLVFTGNPGTGKTTVARLLAQIYRTLGVVPRGHLVETDRSQLVAGFVGQTAIRTREVFDQADGGVLLIDEAYALVRGSEQDFGREAIDTIVKLVEDRRDTTVVIVAGYPDEMAAFIDANPGLRSRFPKTVFFPDYTADELVAIFEFIAEKADYRCDDGALAAVRARFDTAPRDRGFGNGRFARNLFEDAVARHASRIVDVEEPSREALQTLTAADIPPA